MPQQSFFFVFRPQIYKAVARNCNPQNRRDSGVDGSRSGPSALAIIAGYRPFELLEYHKKYEFLRLIIANIPVKHFAKRFVDLR
jgi:hypothetical protein